MIKRNREQSVLPSAEEYRRRRQARLVMRTEEMSEADIEAISRADVPAGHEDLDAELG